MSAAGVLREPVECEYCTAPTRYVRGDGTACCRRGTGCAVRPRTLALAQPPRCAVCECVARHRAANDAPQCDAHWQRAGRANSVAAVLEGAEHEGLREIWAKTRQHAARERQRARQG